jgi:hypothetical protein
MIEVFKTNVQKRAQSKMLLSKLFDSFPLYKINFDLSDCDKILRVEGEYVETEKIMLLMKNNGCECEVLE